MHGMYQLEFFAEIMKIIQIDGNSCLTSGFMTGVPAGQHNSLLNIDNNLNLTNAMNKFSQSSYWSDAELNGMEAFKGKDFIHKAEERFKCAFDRFNGEIHQKAVMFDIWTRQRSFIGYYPRTLEWMVPTVSPHLNKKYINFFMSISREHLDDRRAVELMFSRHYSDIAKIVSNSNGVKSINSPFETLAFFVSKILRVFKLSFLLPQAYRNNSFEFNLPSLLYSKEIGVYPLLEKDENVLLFLGGVLVEKDLRDLYFAALGGDIVSYSKLLTLQAIGLSIRDGG